jgi:BirA family biotin operon repressor/biotin-[acetyl-CoA-carboxylase] ligase
MINKFNITNYKEVTSTLDIAVKLANSNEISHGDVIIAQHQSKGRGRCNKEWKLVKGNIYLTIVLKPVVEEQLWSQISYIIGEAIYEAILQFDANLNVDLKWINDVLIDKRKVAGILLEKSCPGFLFTGIGINLFSGPSFKKFNAISLNECSDKFNKESLTLAFLDRFRLNYNEWLSNGFIPIKNLWLRRSSMLGKSVKIKYMERQKEGIFVGINDFGAMQLLRHNKIEIINAGELYF